MNFKGYKMDGLGNDFFIIDQRHKQVVLTPEQIKKIANRNNLGFDQLIYIAVSYTHLTLPTKRIV